MTLRPRFRRGLFVSSHGQVAEWLCSGLQSRVRRFNSDPGLAVSKKPSLRWAFFFFVGKAKTFVSTTPIFDPRQLKGLKKRAAPWDSVERGLPRCTEPGKPGSTGLRSE